MSNPFSNYDTELARGSSLTLREELDIERDAAEEWKALVEELEYDDFSPTLTDLRAILPNATMIQLNLLHNAILNRVANQRERK